MLREKSMKSGEEKKYSYDSFGRMVRAEVPVESTATREFQVQINRYDGEGLRHEMEENGRLIKFLYNEDREVVAEETSNGTITRYIRGLGIISSDSEEAKTYYHYVSDAQGSITHVLSEDAEILNHYNYDAFGNIIEKTEQVENRFCYNGEMLDSITKQYYLRARFYNPVIGRFTQEDTYYGDGLNLYQYCQANPVGYVDPSGHNCEIVQNHYEQYQEYRKQHPRATAADAYQSATEKKSVKKDGSESGSKTVKNGATRAAQYSSEWGDASLQEAIDKFVPNVEPVVTSKGKFIYNNQETGISVVYDKNGNYFRIEDTTRPRGRNYLDIDGNDMNNEVVNGKTRGRSRADYQRVTHFNNSDK